MLSLLEQQGWAEHLGGAPLPQILDALALQHQLRGFTRDPTASLVELGRALTNEAPEKLVWIRESSNKHQIDLPWLSSLVDDPTGADRFHHGTRPDLLTQIAARDWLLQAGPRREQKGASNPGRVYASCSPATAAWYAACPLAPDSQGEATAAHGPLVILECEATPQHLHDPKAHGPHDGKPPAVLVHGAGHHARLIYPRAISVLIRMDWAHVQADKSRLRTLSASNAISDCDLALSRAQVADDSLRAFCNTLHADAVSKGRTTADLARWPPPAAATSATAAAKWVADKLPPTNHGRHGPRAVRRRRTCPRCLPLPPRAALGRRWQAHGPPVVHLPSASAPRDRSGTAYQASPQ